MLGLLRHLNRRIYKILVCGLLGLLFSLLLWNCKGTSAAAHSPIAQIVAQSTLLQEQQGQVHYNAGQFAEAERIWSRVVQAYEFQGDRLNQVRVLSNLASAYQQLGRLKESETAIAHSLSILNTYPKKNSEQLLVLAQVLNAQGSLQLSLGQTELALAIWQQATATYTQAHDTNGIILSLINQAQAMKSAGLYSRALTTLTQVNQQLQQQPDSLMKIVSLRSLGQSLRVLGNLEQAEQALQQGLEIAQRLNVSSERAALLLTLGNLSRAQQQFDRAIAFYRQSAEVSPSSITKLQAQINQFSLLLDQQQIFNAQTLLPSIEAQIQALSPSRAVIYARLNLARHLMRTKPALQTNVDIAKFVAATVLQARNLSDRPAEAYALGMMGSLYEQTQQWSSAKDLTQKALLLAQSINAPEITYLWQWQVGRILKAQEDLPGAEIAYTQAVSTLQLLRRDLVAIDPEVQLSFRDSVEPVYRELVSLLLQSNAGKPTQQSLTQARQVIESLQLAELNNFFQEACLDAQTAQTDQVDPQAAVLYPIILPDRLEIILSLPRQPLRHYTIAVPQSTIDATAEQLRQTLVVRSERDYLPLSQQLYEWLIRSLEPELTNSGAKTLVFVLDGSLRNVPMAALYDGKQYLIEKYEIALTPGLHLFASKQIEQSQLRVLSAGLTEARQGFSPLKNVAVELQEIQAGVPSTTVLLNQTFTCKKLQDKIQSAKFSIVHIATHGQFSSKAAETFILTWDDRINAKQLNTLLQPPSSSQPQAIELLVLSACETAAGDKWATLGLAGVAVKAGARSTIASLWAVNDEATAELMSQFYKNLVVGKLTKAAALRQAQLTLLQNPQFQHPIYWSPYVLVGNWL